MALATYRCPSKGCGYTQKALRDSQMSHLCKYNGAKYTEMEMIEMEVSNVNDK